MQPSSPQIPQQPTVQPHDAPLPAPQKPAGNKKILAIIGAVVAVIAILGAAYWWMATEQSKQYAEASKNYDQTVKTAFIYYRDIDDSSKHSTDILKKFDDALAAQPQKPNVLGIPVGVPADSVSHVEKLVSQLTAVRDGFKNLHALNDYAAALPPIIKSVGGEIDSKTITAAQPKFKKAVADLKALTPPDRAKAFHQEKLAAFTAMSEDVDAAVKAVEDLRPTVYLAAVQKLQVDIAEASIPTMSKELNAFYDQYYAELAKAYDTLATTLGL